MIQHFVLVVTLLFINQICFTQNWSISELSAMPERVSNNAVAEGFINGQAYVYSFGGIDSTKSYQGIHLHSYRYDVAADQWSRLPDLPDTLGKIAASASRLGDIIYIIGGYHVFANGDELSSERVHRFHIPDNQFLSDASNMPVPIDDQVQAVWRDSLIYVITGWSNGENVSNVQIYNPATDSWQQGTALPASESYRSFGSSGTIVGDTIFFFGGAGFDFNFPAQANFRKGVIDPANPANISWSISIPNGNRKGYRMAATTIGEKAFWIGGSDQTYNFDGIAYSNGLGVAPVNRILEFDAGKNIWTETQLPEIPMDLRGIGNIGPKERVLAGGMLGNQQVSNRSFLLSYNDTVLNTLSAKKQEPNFTFYPNPVRSELHVQTGELPDGNWLLTLSDSKGSIIHHQLLDSNPLSIPMSQYTPGIYLLTLGNGRQSYTSKVMLLTDIK